ncbi:MAG: hypothetical protein HZB91_06385 [Elusimicrobia bacterium]|nr:hypothetical protein [Elusimicrobiota bacterium]
MCGKCEQVIGKVGVIGGIVSLILAMVSRLFGWVPFYIGPRSFAATAAILLLLAIAANTCKHDSGSGSC